MLYSDHCRLLNLVGSLGKSYVVWEEIFDNGLQVSVFVCTYNMCISMYAIDRMRRIWWEDDEYVITYVDHSQYLIEFRFT